MLTLPSAALNTMLTHLRRVLPAEGCGLLAGRDGTVTAVLPIANVATRRDRFRMAPAAQVGAMLDLDARGLALLAIYHSHPHGAARPSAADLAAHAYPEAALLIVGRPAQPNPSIRAWQLQGPTPMPLLLNFC